MAFAKSWNSAALIIWAAMAAGCQAALPALPLFFGFFPENRTIELGLKQLAQNTLAETLDIDEVRRLYCRNTNHSVDTPASTLIAFANTNPTDDLHITSFYCNYGNVAACAAYAAQPAVQAALNRSFEIHVTAVLLTPRTFGYRAMLGPDALAVWGNGEGESVPGQRAHLTVATSPGVSAVQTGLDLLAVSNRPGRALNGTRVLDFGSGQFLVLLSRAVRVVYLPSDVGKAGAGVRPAAGGVAAVLTTALLLARVI